jgi:uncharacterized membrane protein YcaP (DUF421 family)
METFINSILVLLSAVILLRLFGRRSISQMTISQTVLMISIGSLIVSPLASKTVSNTIFIALIFVAFTALLDFVQLKVPFLERLITGKSIVVINNGIVDRKNLKKLRMTVDQLKLRLRQVGITNLKDVKTVTVESNGQIGYEYTEETRPVTMKDLQNLMKSLGIDQDVTETNSGPLFNDAKVEDHSIKSS